MRRRRLVWLIGSSLVVFLLVMGCGSGPKGQNGGLQVGGGSAVVAVDHTSLVRFALSGGESASYMMRAAVPTSKLRHEHREFTIDVVDSDMSIFIVFYGYQGPGKYVLSQYSNGGDVHIGLGKEALSWDLTMEPRAECVMTVESDTPMKGTGQDRMKGSFSCPFLYSSVPAHRQKPVTLKGGIFDIAIIVES